MTEGQGSMSKLDKIQHELDNVKSKLDTNTRSIGLLKKEVEVEATW